MYRRLVNAQRTLDEFTSGVPKERLLRWSLGAVFFWFGMLKLVDASPVFELLRRSYPQFATPPLLCALTAFEILVGVMLLFNFRPRLAATLVVLHLTGTFGVIAVAPRLVFAPHFPILTLDGEFVMKNLVLLAAALAVATQKEIRRDPGARCALRFGSKSPVVNKGTGA